MVMCQDPTNPFTFYSIRVSLFNTTQGVSMRRVRLISALVAIMGLLIFGCFQKETPEQPGDAVSVTVPGPSLSALPGTEALGPVGGLSGTGIACEGVGLRGDPATDQPNSFFLTVPGNVTKAFLYWEGQMSTNATDSDIELSIDGGAFNPITGTLIGGPTEFFSGAWSSTNRYDITALVNDFGMTDIAVQGLDFDRCSAGPDCRNNGVGAVAVYDDGGTAAAIEIYDGNDCAFFQFAPPLDTTVPVTFTFPSSDDPRTGNLCLLAGSVANNRPNIVRVTPNIGVVQDLVDEWQSIDGPDWDAISLPIDIPAGATEISVQALSEKAASSTLPGLQASFTWLVAGLSVEPPPPPPSEGCRVTGGAVDENNQWIANTWAKGQQKKANGPNGTDSYRCGGQAGAPTASPPQPWGEWTHRQQKGPSGSFTFHAGTASAPPGTEIDFIVCNDPGWCVQARPAPFKQIDFGGVGTFKNIKNSPLPINTDDLYYFEVNIDDLGEPGKSGKQDPPGGQCNPDGFGLNSSIELGDCDCPDYYRIQIWDGPDDSGSVIYEVQGYIRGGNFQIHPPTGADGKKNSAGSGSLSGSKGGVNVD